MNQKKKLSTKLIILIPVFILGIFSIISNVMSVSNIRNVNRSAVQISEVSLKNVSGLAEIQKQTQDIHNLGLSHIIAVDLDSMIQLVEKIRASVPDIAITTAGGKNQQSGRCFGERSGLLHDIRVTGYQIRIQ